MYAIRSYYESKIRRLFVNYLLFFFLFLRSCLFGKDRSPASGGTKTTQYGEYGCTGQKICNLILLSKPTAKPHQVVLLSEAELSEKDPVLLHLQCNSQKISDFL